MANTNRLLKHDPGNKFKPYEDSQVKKQVN